MLVIELMPSVKPFFLEFSLALLFDRLQLLLAEEGPKSVADGSIQKDVRHNTAVEDSSYGLSLKIYSRNRGVGDLLPHLDSVEWVEDSS